jgi:hypothetical protein
MDILIRGVPQDELFSIPDLVNTYLKTSKDKPFGIYHASTFGRGEGDNWKPRFGVYKVKSGIVIKWIGEGV